MRARVVRIIAILVCCCALGLPGRAAADSAVNAAGGISMDVRVGYGGAARLGSWVPVQVEVANDGQDLAGRIEVQFEAGSQPVFFGPPPTVYSTPATFPQHSHKRLVVDVPVPPALRSSRVQVRLVSGNQTVLQRAQEFTPVSSGDLVCGVLDQTVGAYDFLGSLNLPGRQQPAKIADLTLADLPDQGTLLNGLDCLVVGNANLTAITPAQKLALTAWVGNGGLLIVTGGVNWQQSVPALPSQLLPEQVSGISTLSSIAPLDRFAHTSNAGPGPWPIAAGTLNSSAVVAGDSTTPLLSVRRVGAGTVFFYALDPTQEPARSWSGNRFLWPYMLGFANTPVAGNSYQQSLSTWGPLPVTALGALPNLNPPPPVWLLWFLLGYGALVGPLAFLLLRRLDRSEWLLVVLPLVAVIGTVTTARLALRHQGSDVAATEVTLLRTAANSPVALTHSDVGLFSPRPQTVDLRVPGGVLFASARRPFGQFGFGPSTAGSSSRSTLQVSEGMDVFVPALPLDTGTLSTFTIDTQTTIGGGVIGTLTADNQVIRGQVQNKTGQRISDAALVVGDTVYHLGTLNPNDTRSVLMTLPSAAQSAATDTSLATRLYPPLPAGAANSDDPRRDILDRVFSATSFYGGGPQGGAMFVGWLQQTPVHFEVRRARAAVRQLTLLESQFNLAIDPATVNTISSGLMTEHSLVSLGVTQTQAGHYSISTGGSFGIEYDLPSPDHFSVQTLHLQVDGSFSGGSTLAPGDSLGTIAAFDWALGNWRDLPLVAGDNTYQAAADFVSPTGQVRLRYSFKTPSGSTASGVDLTQFALSASGRAS